MVVEPVETLVFAFLVKVQRPSHVFRALLRYSKLKLFSIYVYNKNYLAFGAAYTAPDLAYCNHPSWTIHGAWAWGFLDLTLSHVDDFVYYHDISAMLLGMAAPILFILNGFILQQGRKIFAFLISLHIVVMYAFFPLIIAVLACPEL